MRVLFFVSFISMLGSAIPAAVSQSQAVTYLMKFGHAPESNHMSGDLMTLSSLEDSIRSFQRFADLPITGELDESTLRKMGEKRCGNPDIAGTDNAKRKKRYALQGSKWDHKHLTYKFINHSPDLPASQVETEIRAAFQWWEDNSSLRFSKVAKSQRADIEILFSAGAHGDGDPFDGPGQTLAHAYFPGSGGNAHFDEAERWSISSGSGKVNLRIVAAHEFGHSLGLSHSDVSEALMAPFYNPRSSGLHSDDIQAIQRLYGKSMVKPDIVTPKPTVPTTTRRTTTPRTTRRTTTKVPPVGACNGRFDAITRLSNGSTYAFQGDMFWRLNDQNVDEGFPASIRTVWGISGKIDAALTYNGNTDIFQGHKVHRFRNGIRIQTSHISSRYGNVPSFIDAAFEWSGNGKIYFIKGEQYWRYNPSRRTVDSGYPKPLSVWRGLPKHIDSAMQWNGKTYFFENGQYYRFDDNRIQVASSTKYPYPRRADEWWLGCKDNTLMTGLSQNSENGGGSGGASKSGVQVSLVLLSSIVMIFTALV
uniref:matrix metalloproteinase-24 n=1 Tax=Ciona intestinalis TaxID=7719 RepID=UPI0000524FD3|nr:matrix metalloproteinase-24 [Ciona intestinalis]|eukprot:XP_002125302.1 matrix metalloproteinase-24 [Ciona intestinalis]